MPGDQLARQPILFTPDRVYINGPANELLIAGEGHTIRVPLDVFIRETTWHLILPQIEAERDRQNAERKAAFERSGKS